MGAPAWDAARPAPFRLAPTACRCVTLIWPYYENPVWLDQQIGYLAQHEERLRRDLVLIVADDGSPKSPAADVMRARKHDLAKLYAARLFRIKVDVRWNWLAARNVAAHHATGWCLFTDIDHQVPPATIDGLQRAAGLDPGVFYTLRRTDRSEEEIHPHPNSFFCHRDLFWKVGGYDEELSGHYGTDGDWRRRASATAPVRMLPLYLDRWEHSLDSSTTRYRRKQPEDAGKKAIVRARGPDWRPRALSFPYEEVSL